MRSNVAITLAVLLAVIMTTSAGLGAQIPTGTISGRVTDTSGLGVPGVTVSAQSPSQQGVRTVVTSVNGDYIIPLLAPGNYTLRFELSGFATTTQTRDLAATQVASVDVMLSPASVTESVTVTARSNAFTNTVQAATNIKQDLLNDLPSSRTLLSAVAFAPSVHETGPSGNFSIGGAMSYENVYMLNGVQVQDNLRGTPFNLFIEDAIQETTVATSGISAEYGRFSGGVINAITKSGGNEFSGSFRTTFTNDDWRTVSPFGEPKVSDVVPTYEFTVGGPILRNKTWFFGAGRLVSQTAAFETGYTRIGFTRLDDEKRFEAKVTQSLWTANTLRVAYTTINRSQEGNAFPDAPSVMDLASLDNRTLPQQLLSVHYAGTLGPRFSLEAQFSQRDFTFENSGSEYTDLVRGTLMVNNTTGARWWSPTFCGACTPEGRNNENILVKGSYFLSTGAGAHQVAFGYDTFNDIRISDNHQSGSDWRLFTSDTLIENSTVVPVVRGDQSSFMVWSPVQVESSGTAFRTHSLFLNDTWTANGRLTVNAGLRWDRNRGKDAGGRLVANDSAFSPRVGVVWSPTASDRWSVHASYAKYVTAVANSVADASSPAGQPAVFGWYYLGPDINAAGSGPLLATDQVIGRMFAWFDANGGTGRDVFTVSIPGIATQIEGSLRSPYVSEGAVGGSRLLGDKGALRADLIFRDFNDFYANRVDMSTGQVTSTIGATRVFDRTLVENTDEVERKYTGLNLQGNYRAASRIDLGGSYTLSRLWGNVDGETVAAGPTRSGILTRPEYFDPAWSFPIGDLASDQRHRARLWGTVRLPWLEGATRATVGVVQRIESGTPYGAPGTVRTGNFVTNPGYRTPSASVTYYYADRDAFRTETMMRTDVQLSVSYRPRRLPRGELFALVQLMNVFNQFQLYNGNANAINTTVLSAVEDPARFRAFNPFTETPVQGTHWDRGPQFGEAIGKDAYTLPRTFQVAIGLRF
jgi:outer membrane receptor protein involved in Fe transport